MIDDQGNGVACAPFPSLVHRFLLGSIAFGEDIFLVLSW
jgi:hypothetical protein